MLRGALCANLPALKLAVFDVPRTLCYLVNGQLKADFQLQCPRQFLSGGFFPLGNATEWRRLRSTTVGEPL
jgi:hypothetical protein